MNTGEKIRQLRLKKGLTLEELGKILGVNKSAVLKYETSTVVNLKRATIQLMADTFEVSPAYIMGWEDEHREHNDLINDWTVEELEEIELYKELIKKRREKRINK